MSSGDFHYQQVLNYQKEALGLDPADQLAKAMYKSQWVVVDELDNVSASGTVKPALEFSPYNYNTVVYPITNVWSDSALLKLIMPRYRTVMYQGNKYRADVNNWKRAGSPSIRLNWDHYGKSARNHYIGAY